MCNATTITKLTKKGFVLAENLAIAIRGNSLETLHSGWVCMLDKGITYQKGNLNTQIFLRSTAKPIQAIPLIENKIKISDLELAVICGSHSGSKKHIEVLKQIMRRFNLKIQDLQCGKHMPFDEEDQLHNNCSGKHIGMLSLCRIKNWDLKNYLNPGHPLQKLITNIIYDLSETSKLSIAVDGCGVPTFSIPVINIAKMFSNFTYDENMVYKKIISAMIKYPFYIGGHNQIDSEIIKVSGKRLIAKVGAEGIIVVADKGKSLVVKIADGSPKIRSFIIVNLLINLGWLKKTNVEGTMLSQILKGEIKNHSGKVVGKIISLL